jgi:hypothetical protein
LLYRSRRRQVPANHRDLVEQPRENFGAVAGNSGDGISGDAVRRHHEEIAVLPALSLLLPFAGALWLRIIKSGGKKKVS